MEGFHDLRFKQGLDLSLVIETESMDTHGRGDLLALSKHVSVLAGTDENDTDVICLQTSLL